MNKKRERFFLGMSNISAWSFAEVNILTVLYLFKNKKTIHGRAIQSLLEELFEGNYNIGNDLLYKVLNSMEKQKYVKSSWGNDEYEDKNKRYIRSYKITDLGIKRLNSLKITYGHNLNNVRTIMKICITNVWGDFKTQNPQHSKYLISSYLFTKINILHYLINNSYEGMYAKQIQRNLHSQYNALWQPSDGVMYPMLSDLDNQGYVDSYWVANDNKDLAKKRTSRSYSITEKGKNLYHQLISPKFGVKNKLIQINNMCIISAEFVYGNTTKNTKKIWTI